jgi:hypothetical protein
MVENKSVKEAPDTTLKMKWIIYFVEENFSLPYNKKGRGNPAPKTN